MSKQHIIAIGGLGSLWDHPDREIEKYILSLVSEDTPTKICLVPTASGDSEEYIKKFYRVFESLPCEASHFSFFKAPTRDLLSHFLEQDIIFVGGGNTKNMLAIWREWKFVEVLREAWRSGVILAGVSAGALCWFEQGVTDSLPGDLSAMPCMRFLPGSFCPHYDSEPQRRPAYHKMIQEKQIKAGYACDDFAAIHFVGENLHKVIRAKPSAQAYSVSESNGKIIEQKLS